MEYYTKNNQQKISNANANNLRSRISYHIK